MEGKTILITGGTGLIGRALTELLLARGYQVRHLSRKAGLSNPGLKVFLWDVESCRIDESCVDGVDGIIHLAGAGIAEKRWTKKRKKEIIGSRTESSALIYDLLRKKPHTVKAVISASAIGYYGDRGEELLTEASAPGDGFLSESTVAWENAVDEGNSLGLRVVKFRTGMVLSKKGGALPQLSKTIKLGLGSPLGSGKQWTSWIHIDDVVEMYLFALENELTGAYNMLTDNHVTNKEMTTTIAEVLEKPAWLPNVPGFILKIALGEMSAVVLDSTKASADKIMKAGFKFRYPTLSPALKNIYAG